MSDDLGALDRYLTLWIGLAMVLGVALVRVALATKPRLFPGSEEVTGVAYAD